MLRRSLCSPSAREFIDLRKCEKKIVKVVLIIKPDAQVRIDKDCYYIDLIRGEAIKVGKEMSKVFSNSAHEEARRLFKGQKVENQEDS